MPERTASDAALRFVRDLTALREKRGVSLDALHETTRVPVDVLGAFESTALYGNRLFNRVYLRSLVRAYASTIEYDAERALLALEEALAGQYDGSLLREVEPPAAEGGSESIPEAEEPDEPRPPLERVPVNPPDEASVVSPPSVQERQAPSTVPPAISWDAVSGSTRNPRVRDPEPPWVAIISGIALLAIVVLGVIWWLGRSPDEPAVETPAQAPEESVEERAPAVQPQPVSLPDTLVLRVTATNGPVREIRIQRDDDVRRPYWIELGESQDFPFVSRVTVEQELEEATISVQGVAYPMDRRDDQGRIVIDRDTVQRLLQQR